MRLYITIISLLLFSCNSNSNNATSSGETKNIPIGKKVLLSTIKLHLFSDSIKKDTFKLVLTGDSLMTSSAVLTVISYKGTQIYSDSFGGEDLSFDPKIENATLAQRESTIKNKASGFFDELNFVNALTVPAKGTCGDHGYPDSTSWFDIHSYKNAIGFHYHFEGEIDDNYIAWSKKQQKVVTYWYNND